MPEFSPAMLRFFLHATCRHAHFGRRGDFEATRRRVLARLRKAAGVTNCQMDMAWMGRLASAAPRLALWRAIGIEADLGGDSGAAAQSGGGAQRKSRCAADDRKGSMADSRSHVERSEAQDREQK